jgi:hypothetical protein
MPFFFIAILTLLTFLISSYGLGLATMKWAVRDETNSFPLLTVIGVGCLIVMGGIMNLTGIAYPPAMYFLLLLGLMFFVIFFPQRFKMVQLLSRLSTPTDSTKNTNPLALLLPPLLVTLAVIFFAVTLLPTNVFNFGDDFQTYIPRPERMLQTGTLAGDPYEVLGLDSLGAQAFLQGFFLLKLPIEYLPGFDAVFSLGLAGALLVTVARKFNLNWVYATLSILTFLVINPQSVNLSALYSGVFVILGLLLTSCMLTERLNESRIAKPLGMAALAGLLISSLITLKTTLAFFAAIYCVLFCLGLFLITQNKRLVLILSVVIVLSVAIAILPWLLLYLPNYLTVINVFLHTATETNANGFSLPKGNVSLLFSTHDLYYGGSTLHYGIITLMLIVLGISAVHFMLRSSRSQSHRRGNSLVAASACAAAIGTFFLDGMLFDPGTAVRYACPVLIATLPFALLVTSSNATFSHPSQQASLAQTSFNIAVLAGTALVLALFGSNLSDRLELAYNRRTTASFPIKGPDIQFNHYVLSEEARQNIHDIQYKTDAGATILAWISMPLHLDFAKNKIEIVTDPGLINPWLDMPLNGNSIDVAHYFKKHRVRYILWEFNKFGINSPNPYRKMLDSPYPVYRRIAERNLYLRNMLTSMMTGGTFLYNWDGFVLFDLNQID